MQPGPQVHVVPHTHWDREWYLPFAVYRQRLVVLMDSLLDALEREPQLRFHLDGQMAVIDDYLEMRPHREPDIRGAAAAGRISLGPWYTLPDEHLVSGEALLRNLELGLARAAELGRPMLVGYVPDQFGHTAQLPQLLRRVEIEEAVLWRGVPAAVGSGVFTWEALDGSAVTVTHMPNGYGHGKEMPLEGAELAARLDFEVERLLAGNPGGPWLVMSGDDHLPVPVGLSVALETAPTRRPAAISSVADFVAARPAPSGIHRGELHSAASSFVLKGTLSARFPLKLRHAALERRLERYIEPLLALGERPWPARELAYCWRQLILNSAHDSICGCSLDQVHEQATERLARAERVADRLWGEPAEGNFFNPSPFEREGLAGLSIGRPEPARGGEVVASAGVQLEDQPDFGDEYTFDPPPGSEPARLPLSGATWLVDEGILRVRIEIDNRQPNHRLRLVVPAETSGGANAGTAFGAVHRPFRPPGSEAGAEYDLRTDPARLWVEAGGTVVVVAGPFEYELLEDAIAVTLLRCVGHLSRGDLHNRPGHAGPGIATPGAQMLGRHVFEVGIARTDQAPAPRLAEVFAHPILPAPELALRPGPRDDDPLTVLSALRRRQGRTELRTYRCAAPFRIEDRWLD